MAAKGPKTRKRAVSHSAPGSPELKLDPHPQGRLGKFLEDLSMRVTTWAGGSWAFGLAVLVILVWIVSGPLFHYSDTWQLVINTGTTIVTFLMVFLIQRSQNKESKAVQLKLNEIVAALDGASNRLIDVEDLSEGELDALRTYYQKLSDLAEECDRITESHSIEEATHRHEQKLGGRRKAS